MMRQEGADDKRRENQIKVTHSNAFFSWETWVTLLSPSALDHEDTTELETERSTGRLLSLPADL